MPKTMDPLAAAPLPGLAHLQGCCEAARLGSVSAAARSVHLSQPAVTQAIGAVEKALGVRLFERTRVGVQSTAAGAVALGRFGRLLARLAEGLAALPGGRVRGDPVLLRSITTTQLAALEAVVRHGGFSAAARALGQSRASVHRATRALEQSLGLPLFEQTSFGMGATRAAAELARVAALAFGEYRQALAEVAALAGDDRGRTVIGALPLARSVLLPRAVLAFMPHHPQHTVSILDGPYDVMLAELRRGGADVLIGALREPPPGGDLVQEPLFDDPLAIVLRAGHPLAGGHRASLRRLARFPWVVARAGSPLRAQFDSLFGGAERPHSLVECNSQVAARGLLLESDCLMLSSANQVHHELQSGELALLPHPRGRHARRIGLTLRRDWRPTPAQQQLLAELRREAQQLPGVP
jgi:LysR family transcriptional regulator, regulator for genes of the gallate degradation pathway